MCLFNFSPTSLKLWPVDAFKNSKTSFWHLWGYAPEPLRVRGQKFFLLIFSWVWGMTHKNLQSDILKNNLGGKFPPGGSDPQNFCQSDYSPPRPMCLFNFSPICQKLWPVYACENSKYVILALLRLRPGAPRGPGNPTLSKFYGEYTV